MTTTKNKPTYALLQNIDTKILVSLMKNGYSAKEAICLFEYEGSEVELLDQTTATTWDIKVSNGLTFKDIPDCYLKGL